MEVDLFGYKIEIIKTEEAEQKEAELEERAKQIEKKEAELERRIKELEERARQKEVELAKQGAKAKRDTSKEKIDQALKEIKDKQLKYSEYRVQQLSGLSINTIKKYREYIEAERGNRSFVTEMFQSLCTKKRRVV